jgi:predicted TIM-barrel fold metal-dependent hydrolase
MTIIDFHAHAFADAVAPRAVLAVEKETRVKAALDGTIGGLLRSMDRCGIARAVVLSIATKPAQFAAIFKWAQTIASDRLIPFPSLHPSDPDAVRHVDRIAAAGFKGIKLHPYYQGFDLDEERLFPIYGRLRERELILLMHTGFDVAFPRIRKAEPTRLLNVVRRFPGLKLVATHLGGWEDWAAVRRLLVGQPIYFETSFSQPYLADAAAREILCAHPPDCLLFGTDSPWDDQAAALAKLRALQLDEPLLQRILHANAARLLGVG